jgi:phosphate transport system substrate-binding protein
MELKVAIDGLSVVVNKDNDFVECLTVDQLQNMWKPGSTVKTWKDVRPAWPATDIKFYSPGADSGTFDYFTEEVVGEAKALRSGPEVQTSEDDNILVQGVQGDKYAIGYYGYAYFTENKDTQKVVAVDGGEGCVEPTDETIESGEYSPLSRPLFIYAATTALQRPEVAAFVEYYLENVGDLLADVGYIRIPDADLEAAKEAFAAATGA